jgi:ribosomal protein L32
MENVRMLPPQRVSYGRTRRRRNHHALKGIVGGMDPLSGMPKMHHRACSQSGYVRAGLKITVPKLKIGTQG